MTEASPTAAVKPAAEVIARALAVAAHKHLLGTARWEKWTPDAKAAIAALESAGYVIAPLFATAPMVEAGQAAVTGHIQKGTVEAIWRAMVEVPL